MFLQPVSNDDKAIVILFQSLVHSMVAEQLNSSSWRHKVIACKILPTLHGDINRVSIIGHCILYTFVFVTNFVLYLLACNVLDIMHLKLSVYSYFMYI